MKHISESLVTCAHRWLLGTPVGAVVVGHCRLCGASRTYDSKGVSRWPRSEARRRVPPRADGA